MIRRQPFMSIDELGAWIGSAPHDVFRLETLDRYLVDSDEADFRSYLAGVPAPDRAAKQGWLDWLSNATDGGRTWRRVHVIPRVTDYVRFEAEWCYVDNASAGEQIRGVDLSETDLAYQERVDDFHLVDGRAAVLAYDRDGRFLYALPVDDSARLAQVRDTLWNGAEPFTSRWARHPEHHRAAVA